MEQQLEQELIRIVQETPWFMKALSAVRALQLPLWCIGAGVIRNLVWDHLHGYLEPSELADVDIAYFDPTDISTERDHALQAQLSQQCPGVPWEVTNQAGVHLWFESCFGHLVEPLTSIEEAVSTWPETATSVAVRLLPDDGIHVIAPLGLQDLFAMIVRRNPRRVSVETYRKRIAEKRYTQRWPQVRIVPS